MTRLYRSRILRKLVLPLLARLNLGDITIKHHYTGSAFRLHSFKHKGYWFHGVNREKYTMMLFEQLIQDGDTIVEVGGHIGYVSLYFGYLVGHTGRVIVFEPGPNNLPYLLKNTLNYPNITVVQKAVGDTEGRFSFYIEELTGQNNTLVPHFGGLAANARFAHIDAEYKTVVVDVVKLDCFIPQVSEKVDFIKIDVEGAELQVLKGASEILRNHQPIIMVETNDTGKQLFHHLSELGFVLLTPTCKVVETEEQMKNGNIFCLHTDRHSQALSQLVGN